MHEEVGHEPYLKLTAQCAWRSHFYDGRWLHRIERVAPESEYHAQQDVCLERTSDGEVGLNNDPMM